jgi:ADP-ribose pyrophosphatase YjhB (NUDIX family)
LSPWRWIGFDAAMRPAAFFHFCPRCGTKQPAPPEGSAFQCAGCGFRYFFNAAIAAAAFITREDGTVLLIRRAREPARGKLAPPGGFVDIGETVEEAVRREVREEVGLELADVRFLCSAPNAYHYQEVTYPVLDIFFTGRAVAAESVRALDDVEDFVWLAPAQIVPADLAFDSMRAALAALLARNSSSGR